MATFLPALGTGSLLRPFFDEVFATLDEPTWDSARWHGQSVGFPMDVAEYSDRYVVKADLAGLSKEEIQVTLHNGRLSIEVKPQTEVQDSNEKPIKYILRERMTGAVARTILLPRVTSEEKIDASMKEGVLTLTIRKDEALAPKKITIS